MTERTNGYDSAPAKIDPTEEPLTTAKTKLHAAEEERGPS